MSGNRSTTRRIYQGMKLVEHWCLAHSQQKQIAGARPRLFRVALAAIPWRAGRAAPR
jgi:hypothetical protein